MILGVGQRITEEEKYSLPLPGKQFGQGKVPRNGNSKLIDLGSSGFLPLSLCEMEILSKGGEGIGISQLKDLK